MFLMVREYGALNEVPDGGGKISRNLSRKGVCVFVAPSFIVRADRCRLRHIAMPTMDASISGDEMRGDAHHAPSVPE